MKINKISGYKNNLCFVNFLLAFSCLLFGCSSTNMDINFMSIFGISLPTLGPIFWNEWLYNEFFNDSNEAVVSYQSFLFFGLVMSGLVFMAMVISFLKGTL